MAGAGCQLVRCLSIKETETLSFVASWAALSPVCVLVSVLLSLSLHLPLAHALSPPPLSVCTCGKKMPAELCCLLLGDLALVRMQKRLQRFGLCFV